MRLIPLRTILVATDLEEPAAAAIVTGQRFAESAGATLHVMHVARSSTRDPSRATRVLADVVREAGVTLDRSCLHVLSGEAAEVITQFASRLSADVIVLGPHRQQAGSPGGATPVSTAHAVASRAVVPCLMVARPLHLPLRQVLVPSDLSETARGAMIVALSWASALRGSETALTALHVQPADRAADAAAIAGNLDTIESELAVARRHGGGWAGVTMQGRTVRGDDAARTIVEEAKSSEADLVVLGTRGLGLDRAQRIGSVSASVSRTTELPLLLVPPAVWQEYARTGSNAA